MYTQEIRQLLMKLALTDDVTYYHCLRVGYYLSKFAETENGKKFVKQAWVTRKECVAAGLLHEIGKINWPRELLLSTEPLKEMKEKDALELWAFRIRHPIDSQKIILEYYQKTGNRFWQRIAQGVIAHHENFNGGGYPYRLSGAEIPLLSRGLSLIDNYSAMTEKRRHREPYKPEETLRHLRVNLGYKYDPFWGEQILEFLEGVLPCSNLDNWLDQELS